MGTKAGLRKGTAAAGKKTAAAACQADLKKREVVKQGLEKKSGLSQKIAEELEQGIFKVACPNGEPLNEGNEHFKEYKAQYKRISTHLRRNSSLLKRLKSGDLPAAGMAAMPDKELMADEQLEEISQFQQEGLREALGEMAEDTAHWTPSKDYNCPRCESTECLYIQNFSNCHGYDEKDVDAAITLRCRACRHLWKEDTQEGGRLAAGCDSAQLGKELSAPSAEKPEIWKPDKDRKQPTWLLPA